MARDVPLARRIRQWKLAQLREGLEVLEDLALLMLLDAQDPDEELCAVAVAGLAIDEAERIEAYAERSGKYGPREPYNRPKSNDFFELLLYQFPERHFRTWLRYVPHCARFQGTHPATGWTGSRSGLFMSLYARILCFRARVNNRSVLSSTNSRPFSAVPGKTALLKFHPSSRLAREQCTCTSRG